MPYPSDASREERSGEPVEERSPTSLSGSEANTIGQRGGEENPKSYHHRSTASELRRRQMLFLEDHEAFTFDFGADADAAEKIHGEDVPAESSAHETIDATGVDLPTTAVVSSSSSPSEATLLRHYDTSRHRVGKLAASPSSPLDAAAVRAFAAEALEAGVEHYFVIRRAAAPQQLLPQTLSSAKPQSGDGGESSSRRGGAAGVHKGLKHFTRAEREAPLPLEEAVQCFQNGLRVYEEGLWRAKKKRRLDALGAKTSTSASSSSGSKRGGHAAPGKVKVVPTSTEP